MGSEMSGKTTTLLGLYECVTGREEAILAASQNFDQYLSDIYDDQEFPHINQSGTQNYMLEIVENGSIRRTETTIEF